MSNMKIRFFTIADYNEEEAWLREQHKNGWKLEKTIVPCFYFFEKCEPEDVVYRLDYKNSKVDSNYKQMFLDYGWEHFEECVGWLYFRKPASEMESEEESEIFSDTESKLDMIQKIFQTRMLPLMAIFLCCIIPQMLRTFDRPGETVLQVIFTILFVIYVYLFVHCGFKLKKIRKSLQGELK